MTETLTCLVLTSISEVAALAKLPFFGASSSEATIVDKEESLHWPGEPGGLGRESLLPLRAIGGCDIVSCHERRKYGARWGLTYARTKSQALKKLMGTGWPRLQINWMPLVGQRNKYLVAQQIDPDLSYQLSCAGGQVHGPACHRNIVASG